MTYTFKLARRLAVSRRFGMLPAILLFAACGGDATAPEYPTGPQGSMSVSPSNVIVETNQLIRFLAYGRNSAGDSVYAPIAWRTTGGTILPDGRFSSAVMGSFMVTGTTFDGGAQRVDTSMVKVVRRQPHLASIEISPGTATLAPGMTQSFLATGHLKDGRPVPVGAVWNAGGGTIDAGGNFVAGDTAGTYRVIATHTTMTIADTATVTINAPPPASVLTKVTLLPASATLAPSTTRQFTAKGTTATGDSIAVSVVFSATGGTVTAAGVYTAGTTAGTYRVIATSAGLADTSSITVTQPLGSGPGSGISFGPYGLWASATSLAANAGPFGASLNYTDASTIVAQIDAARSKGQKLILGMTACCRAEYATNGDFTLSKWKARQDRFNTTAIKSAIAAGVSDGTVIGAKLLDEPEHTAWGTGLSKSVVDQMAAYTKSLFPTLPVGVSHGPPGYRWRTDQTYQVLDWVNYQYNWAVSGTGFGQGDAAGWRYAVLTQAAKDGVAPSFSLNLLDGGTRLDGCPQPQTGGTGTFSINCRMTAAQVESFGKTLGPAGCVLLMWKYDDSFMARADNQAAFADVAQALAGFAAKSCRRPGPA